MKTKSKPIFQAVLKYRYPVPAIASVLHRISGVILFLFIPLLLGVLQKSLHSAEGFEAVKSFLKHPLCITLLWITLAALIYHLVAGIRHLLMDMGVGESLKGGRLGSYLVFFITLLLLFLIGIWL